MISRTVIFISIFLLISQVSKGQVVSEIAGKVKIAQLDKDNNSDSLVIKLPDGSLGLRDANSISNHQVLSISNDTIFLEDGGFVKLPNITYDSNLVTGNYSPKIYFGNPVVPPYQSNEQAKLMASDAQDNDRFGGSVSISGDYAIVGATLDDNNGSYYGAAFIYKRSNGTWMQQTKLTSSDSEPLYGYGFSVAISGDYAIVGSPNESEATYRAGAAYIYKRVNESWVLQSKISALGAQANKNFGYSVSISGDYAVVGAQLDNHAGVFSGSAYIFKRNGNSWYEQTKLVADDANQQSYFGTSVSISGDRAIIGSALDDDNEEDSGSAYIFIRSGNNWFQYEKIRASDPEEGDRFGYSVSISGDYAVVGAYRDDDNGKNSGSAYIFEKSGLFWREEAKLTPSDLNAFSLFGHSVSISGTNAVVGAYRNSPGGSAYLYVRSGATWVEQAKFKSSDADENDDQFGFSVFISGIHAIVGARFDENGGAAYIY